MLLHSYIASLLFIYCICIHMYTLLSTRTLCSDNKIESKLNSEADIKLMSLSHPAATFPLPHTYWLPFSTSPPDSLWFPLLQPTASPNFTSVFISFICSAVMSPATSSPASHCLSATHHLYQSSSFVPCIFLRFYAFSFEPCVCYLYFVEL